MTHLHLLLNPGTLLSRHSRHSLLRTISPSRCSGLTLSHSLLPRLSIRSHLLRHHSALSLSLHWTTLLSRNGTTALIGIERSLLPHRHTGGSLLRLLAQGLIRLAALHLMRLLRLALRLNSLLGTVLSWIRLKTWFLVAPVLLAACLWRLQRSPWLVRHCFAREKKIN
jgi:hypothetical protein